MEWQDSEHWGWAISEESWGGEEIVDSEVEGKGIEIEWNPH